MAADTRPHGGRIVRGVHVFPVRVYYEDTDAGGVVYYANYLKYAERARTEMMHLLDPGYADLIAGGRLAFAVRRCEADFLSPARLDDVLEIHTRAAEIGGASVTADQVIRRNGEDVARLVVRLACLGPSGRAVRMPDHLRAALARVANNTSPKPNPRKK